MRNASKGYQMDKTINVESFIVLVESKAYGKYVWDEKLDDKANRANEDCVLAVAFRNAVCEYTSLNNTTNVESGSNVNGNWAKYPDGTLMQYGVYDASNDTVNTLSGSMYISDQKSLSLPMPHMGAYMADFTLHGVTDMVGGTSIHSYTSKSVDFYLWTSTLMDSGSPKTIEWSTKGRWK